MAHFEVETFVGNFLQLVSVEPMTGRFDGHANCFVESGHGKGLLLDFNQEPEPLLGTFPLPVAGPPSPPECTTARPTDVEDDVRIADLNRRGMSLWPGSETPTVWVDLRPDSVSGREIVIPS